MKNLKMGAVLAKKRRELGLTQREVAESIGMGTDMAWSLVERGHNTLSRFHFVAVSEILKIEVEDLIKLWTIEESKKIRKMIFDTPNERRA
jgi:transcriptional regulator with XRE-family HTH domain